MAPVYKADEFNPDGSRKTPPSGNAAPITGDVARIAADAPAIYNIANSSGLLSGGSEAGAGLTGATGNTIGAGSELAAGNAGASGAAAAAGQGLTGGIGLGGLAAGAYTGYQQGKGIQRILKGDNLDAQQQAALALPTFGASLLYNPIKKLFGGKSVEQQQRDRQREEFVKAGVMDKDFNLALPTGESFNFGKDGSQWAGKNDTFDYSNPINQQGILWLRPAALMMSGGDVKNTDNWVRAFTQELGKSGTATIDEFRNRVYGLYTKLGKKPSEMAAQIKALHDNGKISDGDFAASMQAIDSLKAGAAMPDTSKLPQWNKEGTARTDQPPAPAPQTPPAQSSPVAPPQTAPQPPPTQHNASQGVPLPKQVDQNRVFSWLNQGRNQPLNFFQQPGQGGPISGG